MRSCYKTNRTWHRTAIVCASALAAISIGNAGLAGAAQSSAAASFPAHPLRIVVPYAPGGGGDLIVRIIATKLFNAWGQPVIVDNRGGGGTIIGTEIVAKAPPDGYTILLATNTHAINPSLYSKLPYDSVRDFAPITLLATAPNILLLHPAVRARTLREFLALAKASEKKLNYGSSGNGGTGHLAMEMLKSMTGIDLTHVPYKGGGPAMNAVLAGEVSALFNNMFAAVPQVKAGRLTPLGVTSEGRSPALPDIPTIAEAGVPGFEATSWFCFLAPGGTPPALVGKWSREIGAILKLPDVRDKLAAQGVEPVGNTPQEFGVVLRNEMTKWAKVIKSAHITVD